MRALRRSLVVLLLAAAGSALNGCAASEDTTAATGGEEEFTHVYDLNGDLEDAKGGPALVATGGTIGPEGFDFEPGDGLTADVDLGAGYTIEMRVRLDEWGHAIKLLDFSDLASDAGLYVFDWAHMVFWFSEHCGDTIDEDQGCWSAYSRQPLAAVPYEFEPGQWATVRFTRDSGSGSLSAAIADETQSWVVVLPPWAADPSLVEVGNASDFAGEATQAEGVPLHVLLDDAITRSETGSGELDYLKIALE